MAQIRSHWDVQLVKTQKPTEKKAGLLRVLMVNYMKAIRKQNPDAFIELVKMVRDAAE